MNPSSSSFTRHFPSKNTIKSLENLGIPLSISSINGNKSSDPCSNCNQSSLVPFNLDDYPPNFSIDTTSPLLGNLKPFDHLVLCSTGKTDWPHDVCKDPHSISGALRQAYPKAGPPTASQNPTPVLPGILPLPPHLNYQSSDESSPSDFNNNQLHPPNPLRVSILNSSHFSNSNTQDAHSLIILPDWIRIIDVTIDELPKLGPGLKEINQAQPSLKIEKLPYEIIILICSHKTRDKRCAISAPLLEEELIESIQTHHLYRVDQRADYDLDHLSVDEDDLDRERLIGLFKVSHSGGHKFAGNVIINFRSGVSVWYGRVTPSDCKRIVEETIFCQKVIPELLKGGVGLNQLSHCQKDFKW